jgi:hypothetical protein
MRATASTALSEVLSSGTSANDIGKAFIAAVADAPRTKVRRDKSPGSDIRTSGRKQRPFHVIPSAAQNF